MLLKLATIAGQLDPFLPLGGCSARAALGMCWLGCTITTTYRYHHRVSIFESLKATHVCVVCCVGCMSLPLH